MGRIIAILAVVALLFCGGSAWAHYDDDTASANKLFVRAMQLSLSAKDEESLEKKAAALEASLAKLNEILTNTHTLKIKLNLEAGTGIEPVSKDLQSSA